LVNEPVGSVLKKDTEVVDRLKVAVIGLGAVAEPHLLAYKSLSAVSIIGVVEPRRARLTEIEKLYGVQGYETTDALLAEQRPHVACILTPAATHRAVTEQFAASGVHVLCEKPIAVTIEDAVAMAHACARAGTCFFYGSSYRYLPAVERARSIIQSGILGEIRLIVESVLGGDGLANYRPMSDAHYPQGGAGGGGYGLVDHGIHMLDIFPWLCGSPIVSVLGRGDRTGGAPETEFAMLKMLNRTMGFLMYDSCSRSTELPYEGIFSDGRRWVDERGWVGEQGQWDSGPGSICVYGTRGSLRIFHYANKLFINTGRIEEIPLVSAGATPGHFGLQLHQFHEDLRHNRPPATSAADGIRALQALHAIYESEGSGQWRPVPGTA
jgi:predicted dehydrogenase